MASLRPSKLFSAALLKSLEYRNFGGKSTKSLEQIHVLVLNVTIFQKFGPRADLGWPWLF
jgi:hypothetical protein